MKTNYHSHTYFCGHAIGKSEDYIKNAIIEGYSEYGISDHGFLPDSIFNRMKEYPWLKFQMDRTSFADYLNDVNLIKEKYKNKIKVLAALEVEYVLGEDELYRSLLKNLDYLILGFHYCVKDNNEIMGTRGIKTEEELECYVSCVEKALKTGFFKIIAHPDIFLYDMDSFDERMKEASLRIIKAAVQNNVYLEFNLGGIRKGKIKERDVYHYPREEFWQLVSKEKDAKVIIGLDAHNPNDIFDDSRNIAIKMLKKCGVSYLDKIDF